MIEERENTVELFLCVFPANKPDLGADHRTIDQDTTFEEFRHSKIFC